MAPRTWLTTATGSSEHRSAGGSAAFANCAVYVIKKKTTTTHNDRFRLFNVTLLHRRKRHHEIVSTKSSHARQVLGPFIPTTRYCGHVSVLSAREQWDIARGLQFIADMTLRRRTSKLICGGDLHDFALMTALVVLLTLSVVMTCPSAAPQGNWGRPPRIHHEKVLGAWTWGANRDDAMIVTVTRDGQIYFSSDRVSTSKLPDDPAALDQWCGKARLPASGLSRPLRIRKTSFGSCPISWSVGHFHLYQRIIVQNSTSAALTQ